MSKTAINAVPVGRPRVIDDETLGQIIEMKEAGNSFQKIADALGYGKTTIIEAINGRKPTRQAPANDNHPDRTTRMSARNGGCSTTSGMMPVTLRRIPTIDGPSPLQVAA
ncbi:hypothetical protein AAIH70_11470 [Neorhizobium sp. BT27B]|uniref:hypothetical protein n=1 Tax=Neorhizobium sp. BT27B TaxID=3142625 RepID=UPI003D2C84D1